MSENPIVLDILTRVAPLGLRFWDPASNRIISDGLQVTAAPQASLNRPRPTVTAFPNQSGVFVFNHLPGLAQAEAGKGDDDYWRNPPAQRLFTVTVKDVKKGFLPFSFDVMAPFHHFYSFDNNQSLPLPLLPGQPQDVIPLFPAPQYAAAGGQAVLRASIAQGDKIPAPWTLLEAYCQGELIGRGMADDKGQTAIFFSYPPLIQDSPIKESIPLSRQNWMVELNIFFSFTPPYPEIPDLGAVMGQASVTALESVSPPISLGPQKLVFGKELIIHSQSISELWIA